MNIGLAHTGISTKDMQKSLWFYTEMFDGKIIMKIEEPKGTPWIEMVRFSDYSILELFYPRPDKFPLGDKLGRNHLAFKTDDIKGLREKLIANKVEGITEIITARDGNLQMWCLDPNDYRIEILEYKKDAPQITDGPCITLY